MGAVQGRLTTAKPTSFAGYRVTASFDERIAFSDGDGETVFVSAIRVAEVNAQAGTFAFELPADGQWREPVALTATTPAGETAGARTVKAMQLGQVVTIEVAPALPTAVEPSPDPTHGRRVRLTGRVLDPDGTGGAAGLMVVIWGLPLGGAEAEAFPAVIVETTVGGYFAETWPSAELAQAWAVLGGREKVSVPLDDGRLPQKLVLVATEPTARPAPDNGDAGCDCDTTSPPRAPDPADMAMNPAAFAADKGGCVDMTVPNRTLEEVTFHTVVRTTQPEIKGVTLPDPSPVPADLVQRLADLAVTRSMASIAPASAAPAPEARRPELLAPGTSDAPAGVARVEEVRADVVDVLAGRTDEQLAVQILQARAALGGKPLRLQASVLAELARYPGELTAPGLLQAERVSKIRDIRDVAAVLGADAPGRVELDATHVVDWDETPTTYQATTIAHGHLLTVKQVWRADGYSLGDLLYSLPLAPGQRKLVAVVDWGRQEDAIRQASRRESEALSADLAHDRDISEIIDSSLRQHVRGTSRADTEAVGGALGGFIGPVVFGGGGGISSAGSTASQSSSRDVAGTSLNQARDRTLQAASSVRSQRATVVQSAREGESVRVQTDVVSNHNHCHALTIEYFEVLRHFQVSQELAHVQECLFVPFELSRFTLDMALRHRDALLGGLRQPELAGGFDALEHVRTAWSDADVPVGRYADELIMDLDGELWMTMLLPRPKDTADDDYDEGQWAPYAGLLSQPPDQVWATNMGVTLPADRDRVWNTRLAPRIADRLVNRLTLALWLDGGADIRAVALDSALVSRYQPDQPLFVSLRPMTAAPTIPRARVTSARLAMSGTLPASARIVIRSASLRYRTDHLEHALVPTRRVDNDLGESDAVELPTPLDRTELRNPREEDRTLAGLLLNHLEEHVEHYHQAIWLAMDPNRRFLLLDGFVAPNGGGRSVASVVENRLIGVVGNCLVMPVIPGLQLDPSYRLDKRGGARLIDLYAADPVPPMRISVPTRGVFAEAVMGACNSCERKDDTRLWRWDESPIPDEPTAIGQVSTATRRTVPPDLRPDEFPGAVVRLQDVPAAPAMTGLAAALDLIGTPNLFADITGLALNQQNAGEALSASMKTASFFASQAGALAQQRFLGKEMQRSIERIKQARNNGLITPDQARTLTESTIKGALGEPRPSQDAPTATPSVQRVIEKAARSPNSTVKVDRPDSSVEVRKGDHATSAAVDVDVDPPIDPIPQRDSNTCWAAAGAMLHSWEQRQSMTIETALDQIGSGWRERFEAHQPLTPGQVVAFTKAVGLTAEPPVRATPAGIAGLIAVSGPLWVIGDDAIVDNHVTHVRIITGIHGDGTPEGTNVTIVDPAGGTPAPETFAAFERRLEADDVVEFGLGIMHF